MIRNKFESDYFIKKIWVNRLSEHIFTDKISPKELETFFDDYNYDFYNIRDKENAAGEFKYKLTRDEALEVSKLYKKFSIYESLATADKVLILQGDVEIDDNFIMRASLSDIKNISNRQAMQNPVYNIYGHDLTLQKDPNIRGLSQVIDYISEYNLIGMVVEFSLYEVPVGEKRENIIIWELRNY